ncbi:Double zinc ribbon [Chthonomonas calidirosea]|uniref:Double zinc ribbon n=1 Tax=Chthonomonas calidirosea (strain DSM 23976 / ICMP 18418 / T49) TaxID=1303518 RepID=S0EVK9_CHTCT|nr:zinc ribbon domain-containing protein [Chthonomonas calidirosea]CCW35461.1 Double zinc ribbon [Chthonomonas calidirosea T49]CEK20208.1 Double zinc ribbon [Chthonomonas calidirosea]
MGVIEFVQNYDDLSTDQGFQFRFYCDHCRNGFMSTFEPNKLGLMGDALRAAGGFLGGFLSRAGESAYDIQRAVGGKAHDAALQTAVQEIKPLFNQCRRCGRWVCKEVCWNEARGLCKQCAPVEEEELASAQAQVVKEQIYSKLQEKDLTTEINLTAHATVTCPHCGSAVQGGKFCPECGKPLSTQTTCPQCHAQIPEGAKFCTQCGTRIGT